MDIVAKIKEIIPTLERQRDDGSAVFNQAVGALSFAEHLLEEIAKEESEEESSDTE